MFRPAVKRAVAQSASRSASKSVPSQRFLSTAPPHQKSRSWKNSAVRWGLAGALIYYYNTTNVFAEEPALARYPIPENTNSEVLSTLDEVAAQRQARAKAQVEAEAKKQGTTATIPPVASVEDENSDNIVDAKVAGVDEAAPGGPQELEEEASQQGAFNEETGEINWDCPCLGGMAYGPCGEQFRDAFSCFVFSKEEPKGMDCIDKFKTMQNCFREHPDIYGAELEDEVEEEARQNEGASIPESSSESSSAPSMPEANPNAEKVAHTEPDHPGKVQAKRERAVAATEQVKNDHGIMSETKEAVPKAWHDSTGENKGKK